MRDNGCGCARGDVRRMENARQRDTRMGGSCGCGRVTQGNGMARTGCGDTCSRRGQSDVRYGCGTYDEPRAEYGQECCALLHRLQELDFSIQETILYLDAYPDCCEAKNYYRQLVCEREQVAKEYERQCGPLTAMGNGEAAEWRWGKMPWPWSPDFPGNQKM